MPRRVHKTQAPRWLPSASQFRQLLVSLEEPGVAIKESWFLMVEIAVIGKRYELLRVAVVGGAAYDLCCSLELVLF